MRGGNVTSRPSGGGPFCHMMGHKNEHFCKLFKMRKKGEEGLLEAFVVLLQVKVWVLHAQFSFYGNCSLLLPMRLWVCNFKTCNFKTMILKCTI